MDYWSPATPEHWALGLACRAVPQLAAVLPHLPFMPTRGMPFYDGQRRVLESSHSPLAAWHCKGDGGLSVASQLTHVHQDHSRAFSHLPDTHIGWEFRVCNISTEAVGAAVLFETCVHNFCEFATGVRAQAEEAQATLLPSRTTFSIANDCKAGAGERHFGGATVCKSYMGFFIANLPFDAQDWQEKVVSSMRLRRLEMVSSSQVKPGGQHSSSHSTARGEGMANATCLQLTNDVPNDAISRELTSCAFTLIPSRTASFVQTGKAAKLVVLSTNGCT